MMIDEKTIEETNLIYLSVIGRKTKKKRLTEIWFVYQDKFIFLLGHPKSQWWKNLEINPAIELTISGNKIKTYVTFNNSRREYVEELFIEKYGVEQITRWYGVDLTDWPVIEVNVDDFIK